MTNYGKQLALDALEGKPTPRVPVALFTWEFDYIWKVAGLEPWQMATGSVETWHKAHMAMLDRHNMDLIYYSGASLGDKDGTLIEEDNEKWIVKNNNNDKIYGLTKNSLSFYEVSTGEKLCDPVGKIENRSDADRLVPKFGGWGEPYLSGLSKLVKEVGERALVLPHHSPAYICACYAMGFEPAMEAMLDDPDLFKYVCDIYAAGDKLRMRELAEAGAQAVFIADGWASCDIISPTMYEKFAQPYQKHIVEAAHEAGLKIILWNEGDILPILKQQATVEMDGFAFEQPRKGVDITVEKIRSGFGSQRCLVGNLDSELLLMRNDPEEIKQAVIAQITQSGQGAPFILNTGSPIPNNVEPESIDLIIETARSFKWGA